MFKCFLLGLLIISPFSWADIYPNQHPRPSEPNKYRGVFTDMYRIDHGTYDGVYLQNATGYRLRCTWGINGHQWVSYIGSNDKTKQLYYDNTLYNAQMVSWRCRKDKDKKKVNYGTYKIYPNKYQ